MNVDKLQFEWDEFKSLTNRQKHGISFETASQVFEDPLALTLFDRVEDREERWHTVGCVGGIAIFLVVHTHRLGDGREVIRIISARKATKHERRRYEEGH